MKWYCNTCNEYLDEMEHHRQLTHKYVLSDMNLVIWHQVVQR